MPPLHLHLAPGTCSLLCHILLRESRLAHTITIIDILSPSGFPAAQAALNPKKRIPILILEDGASVLTETAGITTYISRLAPDAQLHGRTDLDAARVAEWMNWLSGTLHERGFGSYFSPQNFVGKGLGEEVYASGRETARDWILHCYGLVEERLGREERDGHAVGGVFTAADVFLFVTYRWGYLIGVDMEGLYPTYTKVVMKVAEREAVRKCGEIEGVPLIKDNRADHAVPSEGTMKIETPA